jgi:NTE family protein
VNAPTLSLPTYWPSAGYTAFDPGPQRERALVLAGGGAAGIAWESGYLLGLRDEGIDVRNADTVIGTSAGSVVGAHLRLGLSDETSLAMITETPSIQGMGRWGAADALRFAVAQAAPEARFGRSVLGRAALHARTMPEDAWIHTVGAQIAGMPWPDQRLLITAVDAVGGSSVVFTADSEVPIERAVAASCTVPGLFPPVDVAGRRYVDGGVRSIANADLAVGHARVLCLAPFPIAAHPKDWPARQLRSLGPQVRTFLAAPRGPARRAMGVNPFDMRRTRASFAAGRNQGRAEAGRVRAIWVD